MEDIMKKKKKYIKFSSTFHPQTNGQMKVVY